MYISWCVYTPSLQNIKSTSSFHDRDWPGESYDPLLMSLVKSTSNQRRRRQVKEGFWFMDCVCVCVCAIQRVKGQDRNNVSAFVQGLVAAVCVKNCNAAGFLTLNSFPCVSRMVHHPKDIQPTWQVWEALESTWARIPVEPFRHFVESMPPTNWGCSEGKKGATQYS
jgi:hypothetical protein